MSVSVTGAGKVSGNGQCLGQGLGLTLAQVRLPAPCQGAVPSRQERSRGHRAAHLLDLTLGSPASFCCRSQTLLPLAPVLTRVAVLASALAPLPPVLSCRHRAVALLWACCPACGCVTLWGALPHGGQVRSWLAVPGTGPAVHPR